MTETSFAINGRFLCQNSTGVQRYAANVVAAMDASLGRSGRGGRIFAPTTASDPGLPHLPFFVDGPLTGHAWEQLVLPSRWQGRLLNLCNTAPALKNDQIVCIHDANIFASPASYGSAFRMLYRTLQPMLARRSARIVTVTEAAARQIARHLPISLRDIVVLPNGHEHSLAWDPSRAQAAPALLDAMGSGRDRPFVLMLGSRARHKNMRLLVDAAPYLDDIGIDLVIAGGDAGIFNADNLLARPNIKFAGRVSDDDLAYLLDRALCLAFPSLTEGFGLPIVEAMARGCPVIASDCASMPEVCGDAALMASPNDVAAWVRHIQAVKQSHELRADLIGRGHAQVSRFSWSETADGYLDLLERPMSHMQTYKSSKPAVPRVAVVIATRGRAEVVAATVEYLLSTQTLVPETVIVSCVQRGDAGALADNPAITVITGPMGLAAQRNTALSHLRGRAEIVVFFDDDFIADKNWLAAAASTFRDESQVLAFTGRLVADGITGEAIPFDVAKHLVETAAGCNWSWIEPYSPYGCNMAFRMSAIGNIRFDERLVLYGWLEDRDFGAAIAKGGGRLVKSADAVGVHMGVKGGRVSGDRLGYSQIANPVYLMLKGTMSPKRVLTHIGGNMLSNFGKALWPEPFVDRRGRARGNLIAILDVLRGKIQPERAETLFSVIDTSNVKAEVNPR